MELTKSEKLLKRIGVKEECDICHNKVAFGNNWMMTSKKEAVCPGCQSFIAGKGELLVSI